MIEIGEIVSMAVAAAALGVAWVAMRRVSEAEARLQSLRLRLDDLEKQGIRPRKPRISEPRITEPRISAVELQGAADTSHLRDKTVELRREGSMTGLAPLDAEDRLRGHAAAVVRRAHGAAQKGGGKHVGDSHDGLPTHVRVELDLPSNLDKEAAGWLSDHPFPCVQSCEVDGDRAVMVLDLSLEAPAPVVAPPAASSAVEEAPRAVGGVASGS